MSEPKKDNVPKTEVNMALRSDLTPIAEEREIHMMRTFHGIESDDEDETEKTPMKKMSLLDCVAARHFAEKKAAQEAKVKKEENVEIENFKSEDVKSDLKQGDKMLGFEERVLGNLRHAAVLLDILDSEDLNIPGLEEMHGRNKVELDTGCTKGSTQGLKMIPITMEEAMKDDAFRGATKSELDILYKNGVIIPVETNNKLCKSPRRDHDEEVEITGSPKKRPHLLDEKSVLLNTPQSDVTPDPTDDDIEPPKRNKEGEEFITVNTKKGPRKSSGALGKIQTDMKFPMIDGNKRRTRNSNRWEIPDEDESDSDFHKAESV